MKKLKIILMLISSLFIMNATAQSFEFTTGFGATIYTNDTGSSSPVGLNVNFTINKLYIGVSTNLESGDGENWEFISDNTYKTSKLSVLTMNVGLNLLPLNKSLELIPFLGMYRSDFIYQDNIGINTYFYSPKDIKFNYGVILRYLFKNDVGVGLGFGPNEINTQLYLKF